MQHSSRKNSPPRNSYGAALSTVFALALATLLLNGCASGLAAAVDGTGDGPAYVVGTDAPLAGVTSFSVQIQSINALTASGTSVPLISGTPTVDFARFNGLQTLIDMNSVPVGTYTGIQVVLGPATIGYLNVVAGKAPTITTQTATLTTSTVTQTLAAPLVVVKSVPVGLHFDFDLRKSIQVDSTGQITGNVTPTFHLNAVTNSDAGAYIDEFDAAVVSVNATAQTFVIQGPHGRQFTVNVSGTTQFDNNESLASLSSSSIVQLSGTLDRTDATINADEVAILSQDGFAAEGLETYVTPTSGVATSFNLYVRGLLPASTGLTLGQIAQVNLSGSENYFIHRAHNTLTQYLFNSSQLLAGQRLVVGGPASGATNANAVTVKRVVLRQRGYNATVVAGSVNANTNTFQVTVNDFAGLLIPQTVTVYTDGVTSFRGGLSGLAAMQNGATIRVVGLLLKNPTTGATVLLARYVDVLS
jgi:hypothetical protein